MAISCKGQLAPRSHRRARRLCWQIALVSLRRLRRAPWPRPPSKRPSSLRTRRPRCARLWPLHDIAYMAYIAIKGGRRHILYCAIVCTVRGAVRGVPKQRGCLQIIVLVRVQKPRYKTISCKGQVRLPTPPLYIISLYLYTSHLVFTPCSRCSQGKICSSSASTPAPTPSIQSPAKPPTLELTPLYFYICISLHIYICIHKKYTTPEHLHNYPNL